MIKSKDIIKARKTMTDSFKEDSGFEHTYVANIAMLLLDKYNKCNFRMPYNRERAAKDILKLIFNSH